MQNVNCRLIGKLLIRNETKFQLIMVSKSQHIYTFHSPKSGEDTTTFHMPFSPASIPNGKPAVQFRFVEHRPSDRSCFPKKARVHSLSELRLRFPSPPISRLFKTPKLSLAEAKVVNHQKYCKLSMIIWKKNDSQYFTKRFLRLIKIASF